MCALSRFLMTGNPKERGTAPASDQTSAKDPALLLEVLSLHFLSLINQMYELS